MRTMPTPEPNRRIARLRRTASAALFALCALSSATAFAAMTDAAASPATTAAESAPAKPAATPRTALVIHGGAGVITRDRLSAEDEAAIRADPTRADAYFNLARICERFGDTAAAIHNLGRCRRLNPP